MTASTKQQYLLADSDFFAAVCLGVEEWLNFYSTPVRITMRIGPAINFLFHFLHDTLCLQEYEAGLFIKCISCRQVMMEQRRNVGGNREEACTTFGGCGV